MQQSNSNSDADFQKQLAFGQVAEGDIGRYLRSRGNLVLPVYDIEYETGKGPRIFGLHQLIAPDMLVFGKKRIFWAEAKRKTTFSWHFKSQRWTTGIDKRHWAHYCEVEEQTSVPVFLFFLHLCALPDPRDLRRGSPNECPVGLFYQELSTLKAHINHESQQWAYGMVYWAHETLKQVREFRS